MSFALRALEYVHDGQVIGLGTGRAAAAFIRALGEKVQNGLNIRGIPTSKASTELATSLGIPLVSLDDVDSIDVAIDGADEVDPNLDLIKGRGGALVRERIVAAAAKKFVVLVGPEKVFDTLGKGGVIPVEVVPFALGFVRRRLDAMGLKPEPRRNSYGDLYFSDNGNPILDCRVGPIHNPIGLEQSILALPGVVDTGLFLNMADVVIVGDDNSVRILQRQPG